MREIKFRCWYDNFMYNVRQIDFRHRCMEIVNLTKLNTIDFEQGVLMQYTGSKDKNGKEIYEGDILEDEEVRIKVLYELDGFYGQVIKLKKVCGTEVGLKYHLSFFQDDGNDLEVVGNICDNPELLKE